VAFTGMISTTRHVCESCFESDFAEFEIRRAEFAQLIAAGVDRATANRIMIDRIEGSPS
jgi:hypothetical protein